MIYQRIELTPYEIGVRIALFQLLYVAYHVMVLVVRTQSKERTGCGGDKSQFTTQGDVYVHVHMSTGQNTAKFPKKQKKIYLMPKIMLNYIYVKSQSIEK